MRHDKETFESKLADLRDVCRQWKAAGFASGHTRLGQYERELEYLVKLGKEGRGGIDPVRAHAAILMFAEIQEFIFVSRALLPRVEEFRNPKLGEIFSGNPLQNSETNGTARNTLFELTVTALIERSGLKPQWGGLTDVTVSFQGGPILIECKRLQGANKLEANISKAADQLRDRWPNDTAGASGFVALSFSKFLTEGTRHLASPNKAAMQARIHEAGDEFIKMITPFWTKYPIVAGVIAYVSVSGVDEETWTPYTLTYFFPTLQPGLPAAKSAPAMAFLRQLQVGLRQA